MEISISKSDVLWTYLAQFFNIGSGVIVLPVVLHLLSPNEIGLNYLMLSVSSLFALADFGFSSQFGRNLTYVFSGAQELKKEGMSELPKGEINYHLLAVVIETAKFIYKRIAVFLLIAMVSIGTLYVYKATQGFTSVENSFYIWLLFSISVYFNMYFMYYGSLLLGAAMIMESKKAMILNRITYIGLCFSLLFLGLGLFGVVVANFVAPFVGRWYSYKKFYNVEIVSHLKNEFPSRDEIKDTFETLWFNAKKLGINFVGAYGIQQSGIFVIGLFLPLSEVASYGLMCQLVTVSSGISVGVFTTILPVFYKLRIEGNTDKLRRDFSFSIFIFLVLFSILGIGIILLGNPMLHFLGSRTSLPVIMVVTIYTIHMLLENFHSMCASMIVSSNQVPFVNAAILSGIFIVISNLITLYFTNLGLLGIVLGQLIVQSAYNHWKWPVWVFKEFGLNPYSMIRIGCGEALFYAKRFWRESIVV